MAAADYNNKVEAYFVAFLGRPASATELAIYSAALDANSGSVWTSGLNAYLASASGLGATAPTASAAGSMVTDMFQRITGTSADTLSISLYNYYVGHLIDGSLKPKGLANAMLNDLGLMPKSDGTFGQPATWSVNMSSSLTAAETTALHNKVAAANAFTAALDTAAENTAFTTSPSAAITWLAGVTTNASLTTAETTVNATVTATVTAGETAAAQTFTLTSGTDTGSAFTGGAGADTFTGTMSYSNGDLTSAATYNAGDSLNGGAGTDTLAISVSGADLSNAGDMPVQTTAIEKILVSNFETDGVNNQSFDLSLVDSALTTVGTTGSSLNGDTTFKNVLKLVDAQMSGLGDLTVTYAAGVADQVTTDAMALDLKGTGSTSSSPTFRADGIETLNITSETASNAVTLSTSSDFVTVNVTGDKALDLSGGTLDTTVTKVNASGLTAALTVTLGASTSMSLTGGSGNDVVNVGSNLDTTWTLAGGSGVDTLKISDPADLTTAKTANVTGFEVLDATTNSATAYDASKIAGITKLVASAANGGNDITFSNVGATVTDIQVTGTEGVIATLKTDTSADSVTLTYGTSSAGVTVAGQTTLNNYETINLVSQGGANNTGAFSATSLTTLNISGAKTLTLGTTAGDTALATINASGLTGTAELTMTDNASTTASTITGAAGNDVLFGGTKADSIVGGAGNDTISGGAGADTIVGGAGADSIDAGAGTDNISGGDGNDTFYVSTISDFGSGETVDGGSGTDTLSFVAGASTLTATDVAGLKSIEVLQYLATTQTSTVTLTDAVFTANGNTTLTIDSSAATSGALTVSASGLTSANSLVVDISNTANSAGNNISLGAGNDTVKADAVALNNTTTIAGGSGTDTLTLTANTGSGAVTIDATVTGFEVLNFGSATGVYNLTTDNANVASGATLTVDGSTLTSGTLAFVGTAETNGTFVVTGGNANDTLVGGSMNDTISGGSGADSIMGGSGIDNLSGGAGDDTFVVANNGAGFTGLTSAEIVSGGAGNDKLQFLAGGAASVGATDLLNLSSIETISFLATTTNNSLTLTDAVFTADGVTTLTVDASTETSGALTVSAAALSAANSVVVDISKTNNTGANNITLGAGNDTVKVDASALDSGTTIAGGSGTDTLTITANTGSASVSIDATVTGFENIGFTSLTDTYKLVAADANVASGATLTVDGSSLTSGVLSYNGSAELDGILVLKGGAANDTLTGGAKADTITAGSGADVITGGSGADNLTGGAGADKFVFASAAESGGSNIDSVTDFVSGTDKLQFTLDYSGTTSGITVDATVQTAAAGLTAVQNALSGNRGQIIYDTDNSKVYVNNNADNLITSLDYTVSVNPASTAANTIASGDVNVSISGGTGADSIVAGGGSDTIAGGAGVDTINGGNGADHIVLYTGAANNDSITFVVADDILSLAAGGGLTAGAAVTVQTLAGVSDVANRVIVDTAANLGASGVTIGDLSAYANDVHYAVAYDTGAVFYDADGNWTAGVIAVGTLSSTAALTTANFEII